MKISVFSLVLICALPLLAQSESSKTAFSEVKFGFNGGLNFENSTELGSALNVQVQANLTDNLNLYISLGYTNLFDDHGYAEQFYREFSIDDGPSHYTTVLHMVDKVEYYMIPIKVGLQYDISQFKFGDFTPITSFDLGYSFSNAKTYSVQHVGIAGTYDSISEIPSPYDKTAGDLKEGSTFMYGIGAGLKYSFTERLGVSIRYIYQHNDAIVNNNQIIVGLNF